MTDVELHPKLSLPRNRVKIGNSGGLAYRLFSGNHHEETPRNPLFATLGDINSFKNYASSVEGYLQAAETLAVKYNFKLVQVGENSTGIVEILGPYDSDSSISIAGIGETIIRSTQGVEQFFEMLMKGQDDLNHHYRTVMRAVGSVRSSR